MLRRMSGCGLNRAREADAGFARRSRVNLRNPPKIFTEIAIEQLPDIVSFFEHDVPQAFDGAKEPALKAEFAQEQCGRDCRAQRVISHG